MSFPFSATFRKNIPQENVFLNEKRKSTELINMYPRRIEIIQKQLSDFGIQIPNDIIGKILEK